MISTRTLFGAGLAVIAIVSLAAVVVVQQMELQNASRQSTAYVIPPVGGPPSTTISATSYVLIRYFGFVYTSFGGCTPSSGHVYLILSIQVDNHGYERIPIAAQGFGNPYPYYFYLAVGNQQINGYPLGCMQSSATLPMTDVLNGLSVKGYLAYEVPADFGSYSLIYQPPTGNYNVQYANQGFTTATQT